MTRFSPIPAFILLAAALLLTAAGRFVLHGRAFALAGLICAEAAGVLALLAGGGMYEVLLCLALPAALAVTLGPGKGDSDEL